MNRDPIYAELDRLWTMGELKPKEVTMDDISVSSIPMEELFNKFASQTMVEEANRFRTVPRGAYSILITKAATNVTKPNAERGTPGGREYAHFTASVLNGDGNKRGTVFFNASWQEGRRADGKLDGMCKLWGNIEKAFGMQGKSVGDVLQAVTQFPVRAYIDVVFRDPAGTNYYIKNNGVSAEDQEKEYRQAGYEPQNTVLNISAAK